jgi:hypothetical protein
MGMLNLSSVTNQLPLADDFTDSEETKELGNDNTNVGGILLVQALGPLDDMVEFEGFRLGVDLLPSGLHSLQRSRGM